MSAGWQPIETAPANTWVWVFCPSGVENRSYEADGAPPMTMARLSSHDYGERDWYSVEHHSEFWDYGGATGAGCSDYPTQVAPTHWMPLPQAPES